MEINTAEILGAFGVLIGTIGYLYRKIEKRLDDCENERVKLLNRLVELETTIEEIKNGK